MKCKCGTNVVRVTVTTDGIRKTIMHCMSCGAGGATIQSEGAIK